MAYKRTTTDAFAADDSELVFGNILGGTLAFQSTGSPLDGIDNKTPTAFKDAEGMTGSISDVGGANGDFGIRYTLDDVVGTGFKIDYLLFVDLKSILVRFTFYSGRRFRPRRR